MGGEGEVGVLSGWAVDVCSRQSSLGGADVNGQSCMLGGGRTCDAGSSHTDLREAVVDRQGAYAQVESDGDVVIKGNGEDVGLRQGYKDVGADSANGWTDGQCGGGQLICRKWVDKCGDQVSKLSNKRKADGEWWQLREEKG